VKESSGKFEVTGESFTVTIDGNTGMLSGYLRDNKPIIRKGVEFNFWRALTDNDLGWKVDQKMKIWENEASLYDMISCKLTESLPGRVEIASHFRFKNSGATAMVKHSVTSVGKVKFELTMEIPDGLPNIPRIGLQFRLDSTMTGISWYGRGPQENYADRKTGAFVGYYESTLNDFVTPYVRPQENAARSDIRHIRFSNKKWSVQFSAAGGSLFTASAWPWEQKTLAITTHNHKLAKGEYVVLNIDYALMGVGGDNSWGLPVLEKYQVKPGKYHFSFVMNAGFAD